MKPSFGRSFQHHYPPIWPQFCCSSLIVNIFPHKWDLLCIRFNLDYKLVKIRKGWKISPSVSRQIRHWICSPTPDSRSISPGSVWGGGGIRGDDCSPRSAIRVSLRDRWVTEVAETSKDFFKSSLIGLQKAHMHRSLSLSLYVPLSLDLSLSMSLLAKVGVGEEG